MKETNQDIINTTAKAFLRKYGIFMLADALLLIIINICAFMLSLNFIDGDEGDIYMAISITTAASAIMAFLAVFVSGAFLPDTNPKKVSEKTQTRFRIILLLGSLVLAASKSYAGAIASSNTAINNDFSELRFQPSHILTATVKFCNFIGLLFAAAHFFSFPECSNMIFLVNFVFVIALTVAFMLSVKANKARKNLENWTCYHTLDKTEIEQIDNERRQREWDRSFEWSLQREKALANVKTTITSDKNVPFEDVLAAVKKYYESNCLVVTKAWNHPKYWMFYGIQNNGKRDDCVFRNQPAAFSKETGELCSNTWLPKDYDKAMSEAIEVSLELTPATIKENKT